jgi:Arylsulfotransferase (ASST)
VRRRSGRATRLDGVARSLRLFVGLLAVLAGVLGMDAILAVAARADALQISAQPALYPDFDTSISDYVTRCTADTPVQVDVTAPSGTDVAVGGQPPQTGTFTAPVALDIGQSFPIVATTGTEKAFYFVRCLPSDFPASTAQRPGQPQAEWYTVAPGNKSNFQLFPPNLSRNYVAIYDNHGVPVWWLKADHAPTDFEVLPNGNLAWTRNDNSADEEHRLDGSLVRVVGAAVGQADLHEFLPLPNGNYVLTTQRNLPGFDACGQSNVTIIDNGMQEIAPDGSLVWSWWASDHIPTSETPSAWCSSPIVTGGAYDVYHINSIEPDGDGFVLSFRHLDAAYRVSQADGSIVWKLGGTVRPESLTVVSDPIFTGGDGFRGQHDARVLSDGSVTIHDNGFHPGSTRAPRAVRYSLDLSARTATLVEEIHDPGTVVTPLCCGSARRLPGGDWVMSWGSAGLITELSPVGSRVFSLTFDDGLFSYRAHPVLPGTVSRTALRAGMDAQYPRPLGYARPRGASPMQVALVPAFTACTSPDESHGGPLLVGSCSPPTQTSSFLTVGTDDANGAAPNAVGSVLYSVRTGNPSTPASEADVNVNVSLTDVRRQSDLSDYTGQVQVHSSTRLTDSLNGASQRDSGTSLDADFPMTVPCTATADTEVGATCSVSSSFNAIVPGAIVEGNRANWQLGQTQVFDGGATGLAGASDARLFEVAGVYAP